MSNYDKVEALIKTLDPTSRTYLNKYFKHAPEWVYDSLQIAQYDSNHTFITQGEKVQNIIILVKGLVKGTDYPILGAMYDFMWFSPVMAFGALEYFSNTFTFNATLVTASPCTMLLLPISVYTRWMESDHNAMHLEACQTTNQLLYEIRRERVYIFMQGTDRLMYFLKLYYKQFAVGETCPIALTRQEISDCTGLSIRTVNRGITTLLDQGCLLKSGTNLIIHREQYDNLKTQLGNIL